MIGQKNMKYYLIVIILIFGLALAVSEVLRGNEIPIFFPYLVMATMVMLIINWKSALAKFQSKVMILISLVGFVLMLLSMQGGA